MNFDENIDTAHIPKQTDPNHSGCGWVGLVVSNIEYKLLHPTSNVLSTKGEFGESGSCLSLSFDTLHG